MYEVTGFQWDSQCQRTISDQVALYKSINFVNTQRNTYNEVMESGQAMSLKDFSFCLLCSDQFPTEIGPI